ncbi:sigma factor [Paenibacillus sp. FSL M8-0334]|uniref:RNA polymerase sigma factor n=1 Tax=Paenibacillus sp. FSL M8-0334 TaxID=2921623 RepID=UPI0030F5E901
MYRDIHFLTRSHELTEDVVQETFYKVVAKAPQLRDTKHMKAWIVKVARNHAYDMFKKNKKISSSKGASSRYRSKGSFLAPYGSRASGGSDSKRTAPRSSE